MITLLSSLLGFLGAMFPEILKKWQDKADKAHELLLLDRQIEMAKLNQQVLLEQADIQYAATEAQALYATWKSDNALIDALNGSVRPVIAYAMFLLFAYVKIQVMVVMQEQAIPFVMYTPGDPAATLPWLQIPRITVNAVLWGEEDQSIFAAILSFYFGDRGFRKRRSGVK